MRASLLLLCGSFVVTAACGSEDTPAEDANTGKEVNEDIPPAPENGVQIVTAELELPAGEEVQTCYYTTLQNEEEVFVRAFDAFQGDGGHHVILMSPLLDRPDGTVEDCTDGDDMVNYIPLVLSLELNHLELEDGLAIRLPPHAKLVVQSHYINTTLEPVRAKDVVNLGFIEPGSDVETIGFWSTSYLDLAIPPQRASSLKYRCVADQDMQVLTLIGHMHDAGSSLSIDIGPPGALERVYTIDKWEQEFRDQPPLLEWTMQEPFTVRAGDVTEVTCNWESSATETIGFPIEMCASNAWFYPTDASVTCFGELIEGDAAGG